MFKNYFFKKTFYYKCFTGENVKEIQELNIRIDYHHKTSP
jgi:hypothetical protein